MSMAFRWLSIFLFVLCPVITSAQDYMLYAGRIDNETEIDPRGWDILKVDPLTSARQIVYTRRSSAIRETIMDLAYEGDGVFVVSLKLYNETTLEQTAKLIRVDLNTGTQTDVAGPFAGVVLGSLSICSDGQILCSSGPETSLNSTSIVKINPQTGGVTTLYSSSVGSGEAFSGAWLAVEESPTSVIIYCSGVKAFRRINAQTLVRQNIYTLPYTGSVGIGAMFYSDGNIIFGGKKTVTTYVAFASQLDLISLQETPVSIGEWDGDQACFLEKVALASDGAFFCTTANTQITGYSLSGIMRKASLSTSEAFVFAGSGPPFELGGDDLQGPIGLAFAPDFETSSVQDWAER